MQFVYLTCSIYIHIQEFWNIRIEKHSGSDAVCKIDKISITVQKYRFNRLLTKDPSETTSLEYK